MASLFDTGKSRDQIVRETDKAIAIESAGRSVALGQRQ